MLHATEAEGFLAGLNPQLVQSLRDGLDKMK